MNQAYHFDSQLAGIQRSGTIFIPFPSLLVHTAQLVTLM